MVQAQTGKPVIDLVLDTLAKNKQALVFVNSKRSAEKVAEDISKAIKVQSEEGTKLGEQILKALSSPTKQCERLSFCVKRNVSFHHAGLVQKQREIIETAFRDKTIKVICCTPTLAMGVDLPAFRAIIRDMKRFGPRGMAWIPVMEFQQICGRAGRPGHETYGEAIVLCGSEKEEQKVIDDYIFGEPEPVLSKLAVEPVLRTYLLSLIATEYIDDHKSIMDFFAKTLWAAQFQDMDALEKIIIRMLDELFEFEFIQYKDQALQKRKEKQAKAAQDKNKKEKSAVDLDDVFTSAADIVAQNKENKQNEKEQHKIIATKLGKRIAELYIDPLSAKHLLDSFERMADKGHNDTASIFMVCTCLEMMPRLTVKSTEFDVWSNILLEDEDKMYQKLPSFFEDEFYDTLNIYKTSKMLLDWLNEESEESIMNKYNVRPGELHMKLTNADWLTYACEELLLLTGKKEEKKHLEILRFRLKNGVRAELVPLLRLRGVGRVRARKLYLHGISTLGDVKKADAQKLAKIVGKKLAINIKDQVGQTVDEKTLIAGETKNGQQTLL